MLMNYCDDATLSKIIYCFNEAMHNHTRLCAPPDEDNIVVTFT